MSTRTAAAEPAYAERDRGPHRSRLTTVAVWVGIVAGVVFIVAVIFFSGFVLGAHTGGYRWHHGDRDRDFSNMHRGGPPPMGQMGPRGGFGPGGPGYGPGGPGFGPGGPGAQQQPPQQSPTPTTTAPRP